MKGRISTLAAAAVCGVVGALAIGAVVSAGASEDPGVIVGNHTKAAGQGTGNDIEVGGSDANAGGDSATNAFGSGNSTEAANFCHKAGCSIDQASGGGGGDPSWSGGKGGGGGDAVAAVNSSGNSANSNTNTQSSNTQVGVDQATGVSQTSTNVAVAVQSQEQAQQQQQQQQQQQENDPVTCNPNTNETLVGQICSVAVAVTPTDGASG